jgi:PAS domain S-box-containing protein
MTTKIDFHAIFQLAPVGMCVTEHRVICSANKMLSEMFSYPDRALIGQSLAVLYPSADEFERTGIRIIPIMNAKGCYSDERIMRRANQELFWCHVSGRGLHKDDPHAAGIWTFEDVSA